MNRLIRRLGTFCVHTFLISFFISIFFSGCRPADTPASVSIVWRNNKAVGLSIPQSLIEDSDDLKQLRIQLIGSDEQTDILGEFKTEDDHVLFEPVVPLTRGLDYEIIFKGTALAEINIPLSESGAPELLAVYPTSDTLPENLLKIYLKFSQPMVEGRSLSQVTLLRNDRDTMKGTFLDLQPELWNNDGTVLTLWLDPGRIKRDLIPNKELGAPLREGERYTLYISKDWKSKEGVPVGVPFKKIFTTALRDDEPPLPDKWTMTVPASQTKEPLIIHLNEPLDYSLLNDAIRVLDSNGVRVTGDFQLDDEESKYVFTPVEIWRAGEYVVQVESRLEDLAGNNLNRPFDRDLARKDGPHHDGNLFKRNFRIR